MIWVLMWTLLLFLNVGLWVAVAFFGYAPSPHLVAITAYGAMAMCCVILMGNAIDNLDR